MSLVPSRIHYYAIALLAFTTIAMQILLSRIFSVMFFYHFAFAGVTLAMLGLTVGALKVHANPERFSNANLNRECAIHCIAAAVILFISTLLLVDIPGRLVSFSAQHGFNEVLIAVSAVTILLGLYGIIKAFIANGVIITLLLTYFPAYTSKLYAVDLVWAALGAILMIAGLHYLDPISIIFLLASMLGVQAQKFLRGEASHKYRAIIPTATIFLCLAFAVQAVSYVAGSPFFKVRMGKFQVLENLLFERWNTYSHIAIYPDQEKGPFGWGFGSKLDNAKYINTEEYRLKIDAAAGTVLTKFDGDLSKISYLQYDVINLGYHIRDIKDAVAIGVGGGRDILSALSFETPKITGIEINPAIFEALNQSFAEFTGKLGSYPNVHLVNAEARSYINSHDTSHDMIQISLIDTWAATAAGGLSLSENKLYTREAWVEFLDHLNENGILTVSRWFIAGKHQGELYRLVSLATDAVKENDPTNDPRTHVLAANANDIVTLIISKSPFTKGEIEHFYTTCQQYGFIPLITPTQSLDSITDTILTGNASKDFYASLPLKLQSPTDDTPFFFNMTRFSNVFGPHIEDGYSSSNNLAAHMLFSLAFFTVIATGYTIIWPLSKLYMRQHELFVGASPFVAYFMSIGLGFMFIEMALMQRLMIFLGHPVYSLSVILFTMLLFSGIGSYTVKHHTLSARTYITRPLLLCCLLVATGWSMSPVINLFSQYDITYRVLLSVVMLIPISIFMGMMFPLGVGAAEKDKAVLLPWFWALNGVASVLASIISMVLSMSYGISVTFMTGVMCYIICFFICLRLRKKFIN